MGKKQERTWQEAAVKWASEKRQDANDISILRTLDPWLGDKTLSQITPAFVEEVIDGLKKGRKNSTVNRITTVLRSILNKSVAWGWLDHAPKIRRTKEPPGRIRWLTPDEAERLLAELPPNLEGMARLTLATGLRAANVRRLRWADVDLERRVAWVHPDEAKAGKAIGIPLNNDAMVVLRRQQGNHPVYVFTYRGNPIKWNPSTKSWWAALKRAGIEDFRWHDLRHTWASWHVQAGTPLHVLKELGGWADYNHVLRYAHLAPEHLHAHADRISGLQVVTPAAQENTKLLK